MRPRSWKGSRHRNILRILSIGRDLPGCLSAPNQWSRGGLPPAAFLRKTSQQPLRKSGCFCILSRPGLQQERPPGSLCGSSAPLTLNITFVWKSSPDIWAESVFTDKFLDEELNELINAQSQLELDTWPEQGFGQVVSLVTAAATAPGCWAVDCRRFEGSCR